MPDARPKNPREVGEDHAAAAKAAAAIVVSATPYGTVPEHCWFGGVCRQPPSMTL